MAKDVSGTYDIIVANIIADAIIMLSQTVTQFMDKHSYFISSGIIDTKEDEVIRAFEKCNLEIVERKAEGDWRCFVCKKK